MVSADTADLVLKGAEVIGVILIAMVLKPIKGLERRAQEFDVLFAKFGGKIDLLSGAIQKLESSIEHMPKVVTKLAVIETEITGIKERMSNIEGKLP